MGVANLLLSMSKTNPPCCRTPGAVYTTTVRPSVLALFVRAPENTNLFGNLTHDQERKLIADLHDALLPVMEGVYRDTWQSLAGKTLAECGDKPMPDRWDDLETPAALAESRT